MRGCASVHRRVRHFHKITRRDNSIIDMANTLMAPNSLTSQDVCFDAAAGQMRPAPHLRWLAGVTKWVLVLNVLDGVLTILWVHLGLAEEANPLLRPVLRHSAIAFIVLKLGAVSGGTVFLWRRRCHPMAAAAIVGSFLAYYLVLLHHLGGITLR